MDRKLYWYNFGPAIMINLLFLPFWFLNSPFFTYNLSILQTVVNVAILPIYLVIVNFRRVRRDEGRSFFSYIGVMWLAILAANILSYINWGIATGQLFRPEFGTLYLYEWLLIISFSAVLVLTVIGHFALRYVQPRPTV